MLPTWCYIAAFAAFLISPTVRLPAFLCAVAQCVALNFESFPKENYEPYYIAAMCSSFISCRALLSSNPTNTNIEHAKLFLISGLVDAFGLYLYVNYLQQNAYNTTGFYVILTQMLLLFRDGHGDIKIYSRRFVDSIRDTLFIQSDKS